MTFDFAGIRDLSVFRGQLTKSGKYDWLTPLLEKSLGEYVRAELEAKRPNKKKHSPYEVSSNLSIANELANRCLSRRNNIYDLEAKALQAALAYEQDLALIEADCQLMEIRLEADLKIANDSNLLRPDIRQRKDIQIEAIMTRVALHNLKGSSINYGEQALFLRSLYADDLRALIERVYGIKRGLDVCYDYKKTNVEFPNWTDAEEDLEHIIYWLREVADAYLGIQTSEQVRLVYISAESALISQKGTRKEVAEEFDNFYEKGVLRFTINESILAAGGIEGLNLIVGNTPQRIVGLGLALRGVWMYQNDELTEAATKGNLNISNFQSLLENQFFQCSIKAPLQTGSNLHNVEEMGLLRVSVNTPISEDLRPSTPAVIKNFSPFGEWEVRLKPKSLTHEFGLRVFEKNLRDRANVNDNGRAIDVILCLAIASNSPVA